MARLATGSSQVQPSQRVSAAAATTPAETAAPSETPAPGDEASAASPLPWIIGVVIVLAVIGVVLYLLVIRPRGRNDGSTTGSGTGTDD